MKEKCVVISDSLSVISHLRACISDSVDQVLDQESGEMMNENEKGLDKLFAWKKAIDLVQLVYKDIIPFLPPDERWSLTQQIRRSSQSIPANIAEGYGRYYYQDNVRFCYIARGSLEETYSHIRVGIQLGYIKSDAAINVIKAIDELKKILNGYIQFIKSSKQGENETEQYSAKSIREDQPEYFGIFEDEVLEKCLLLNERTNHDYK